MSDLTPQDEALLDRARSDLDPSDDDRARNKRRLYAHLGIGIGAASAAASTSASAGTVAAAAAGSGALGLAVKTGLALVLAGTLAGTAVVAVHSRATPATPPSLRSAPTSIATAPTAPTTQPFPLTVNPGPAPVAIAQPPASPDPSPPQAAVLDPTVAPLDAREPAQPRALPPPEPVARALVARSIVRSAPPASTSPGMLGHDGPLPLASPPATDGMNASPPGAAAPSGNAVPPAPAIALPAGPATVLAEAQLLRDADAALKAGDPRRAETLLAQHSASFPNGALVEEREAERVAVLCALGRTEQARAAASAFLRDRPRSPLATRVRSSCRGTP
jgi:hypothetical protein